MWLMLRTVKPIVQAAASSGLSNLFTYGSSRVMSEDGNSLKIFFGSSGASSKDTFENGTLWNMLLLVFGHFTMLFSLLLLYVTLLCLLSATCLCWLLLTLIQLGYGLIISFGFSLITCI
jgi:hypothetical protein